MGIAGAWDSVVTCFFLDTAHNIVEYIEIISKILKQGGVSIKYFTCFLSSNIYTPNCIFLSLSTLFFTYCQVWINLGPLLYHFADVYGQDDVSISFFFYINILLIGSSFYNIYVLPFENQEMSVELSLEDVKRVAINYGFELEVKRFSPFIVL